MIPYIKKQKTLKDGSIIYTLPFGTHEGYYYFPANDCRPNLINYGFTGPTFLVIPDGKISAKDAVKLADETGLKDLAARNGMGISFLLPNGYSWADDPQGAYEEFADSLIIARDNFYNGLGTVMHPEDHEKIEYGILGAVVRLYVYAFGSGADYVAKYYIKPVQKKVILGDLGRSDISMTCVTLQGGTVLPAAEKNDLHVCSVGNTPEYNKILRKNCAELMTADELDVEGQYKEIMGQWKRWAGAVRRVVNYDEAGIAQIPESAIVPVSPDNPAFPRRFGPPVKEHKIGYVTFYDENLDVKHEKHPLVFVFHGGGDSSLATSLIAEWPEIAKREGFIVVAPEAHMGITATEVIALLEHLKEEYAIDEEKVYSTGFSMGGGKSWDLYEQYPQYFAGIAPMDATGIAVQGARLLDPEKSNQDVLVPMFYIGGCASPLPELPKHGEASCERFRYLARVNQWKQGSEINFEDKENWADPEICLVGEKVEHLSDEVFPQSDYVLHSFESTDGNVYTQIMAVTNHQHELRRFTNECCWNFLKHFRRKADGRIVIE